MGKIVKVEIDARPVKRADMRNGLFRVRLYDAAPTMPSSEFVDFPDEGLKKLGLEDGSAKKGQPLYLLIGKDKLTGLPKFTAIGTHFEAGKDGMGIYSW